MIYSMVSEQPSALCDEQAIFLQLLLFHVDREEQNQLKDQSLLINI